MSCGEGVAVSAKLFCTFTSILAAGLDTPHQIRGKLRSCFRVALTCNLFFSQLVSLEKEEGG